MMSAKAHWWVVDMIKGKYGVDLKDAINGGEAQRWLEAEGDADKDGICNRDEWKQVVDRAPPGASLLAKLELFAEAALNPDIPQK
jgi:hypothetical protein